MATSCWKECYDELHSGKNVTVMVTSLSELSFFDSGSWGISSSCPAGSSSSEGVQSLRIDPLETQKWKYFSIQCSQTSERAFAKFSDFSRLSLR